MDSTDEQAHVAPLVPATYAQVAGRHSSNSSLSIRASSPPPETDTSLSAPRRNNSRISVSSTPIAVDQVEAFHQPSPLAPAPTTPRTAPTVAPLTVVNVPHVEVERRNPIAPEYAYVDVDFVTNRELETISAIHTAKQHDRHILYRIEYAAVTHMVLEAGTYCSSDRIPINYTPTRSYAEVMTNQPVMTRPHLLHAITYYPLYRGAATTSSSSRAVPPPAVVSNSAPLPQNVTAGVAPTISTPATTGAHNPTPPQVRPSPNTPFGPKQSVFNLKTMITDPVVYEENVAMELKTFPSLNSSTETYIRSRAIQQSVVGDFASQLTVKHTIPQVEYDSMLLHHFGKVSLNTFDAKQRVYISNIIGEQMALMQMRISEKLSLTSSKSQKISYATRVQKRPQLLDYLRNCYGAQILNAFTSGLPNSLDAQIAAAQNRQSPLPALTAPAALLQPSAVDIIDEDVNMTNTDEVIASDEADAPKPVIKPVDPVADMLLKRKECILDLNFLIPPYVFHTGIRCKTDPMPDDDDHHAMYTRLMADLVKGRGLYFAAEVELTQAKTTGDALTVRDALIGRNTALKEYCDVTQRCDEYVHAYPECIRPPTSRKRVRSHVREAAEAAIAAKTARQQGATLYNNEVLVKHGPDSTFKLGYDYKARRLDPNFPISKYEPPTNTTPYSKDDSEDAGRASQSESEAEDDTEHQSFQMNAKEREIAGIDPKYDATKHIATLPHAKRQKTKSTATTHRVSASASSTGAPLASTLTKNDRTVRFRSSNDGSNASANVVRVHPSLYTIDNNYRSLTNNQLYVYADDPSFKAGMQLATLHFNKCHHNAYHTTPSSSANTAQVAMMSTSSSRETDSDESMSDNASDDLLAIDTDNGPDINSSSRNRPPNRLSEVQQMINGLDKSHNIIFNLVEGNAPSSSVSKKPYGHIPNAIKPPHFEPNGQMTAIEHISRMNSYLQLMGSTMDQAILIFQHDITDFTLRQGIDAIISDPNPQYTARIRYNLITALFMQRYALTTSEVDDLRNQLRLCMKGIDESFNNYLDRWQRTYQLAYLDHPLHYEEKWRMLLVGCDRDVVAAAHRADLKPVDDTIKSWTNATTILAKYYATREQSIVAAVNLERYSAYLATQQVSSAQHGNIGNLDTDVATQSRISARHTGLDNPIPTAYHQRILKAALHDHNNSSSATSHKSNKTNARAPLSNRARMAATHVDDATVSDDDDTVDPKSSAFTQQAGNDNHRPHNTSTNQRTSNANNTPIGKTTRTTPSQNSLVCEGHANACGANHLWEDCPRNPDGSRPNPHVFNRTGPRPPLNIRLRQAAARSVHTDNTMDNELTISAHIGTQLFHRILVDTGAMVNLMDLRTYMSLESRGIRLAHKPLRITSANTMQTISSFSVALKVRITDTQNQLEYTRSIPFHVMDQLACPMIIGMAGMKVWFKSIDLQRQQLDFLPHLVPDSQARVSTPLNPAMEAHIVVHKPIHILGKHIQSVEVELASPYSFAITSNHPILCEPVVIYNQRKYPVHIRFPPHLCNTNPTQTGFFTILIHNPTEHGITLKNGTRVGIATQIVGKVCDSIQQLRERPADELTAVLSQFDALHIEPEYDIANASDSINEL